MERVSSSQAFGGRQQVWCHASIATGTDMAFGLFLPPGDGPFPLLTWLSGLTCTHANAMEKAGYQRLAADLGIAVLCPDTSPRGPDVADCPDYDLGQGAGFYVDAIADPWRPHYAMWTYVTDELPAVVGEAFPVDMGRQGITGHSMGGHGALTAALKLPGRYRSASAFAPIVAPSLVPWGEKAFGAYLGSDRTAWRAHDAVALIEDGARVPELLVDVGTADPFLEEQLQPDRLVAACDSAGIPLTLGMRDGYDHSYYFVASFMEPHLRWHRARMG